MASSSPDTLIDQGAWAAQQNNFVEAVQKFEAALILLPHSPRVHFYLGNALAALGKVTSAIDHFKTVIGLSPESPEVHNNLGRLLHQQGQLDQAIYYYKKAITYQPHYLEAELNLGFIWIQAGKLQVAEQHFLAMLNWHPHCPVLYEQLAQLALQEQDLIKARQYYEKRLNFPVESSDTWNNIGAVFSQAAEYTTAIDAFKKALSIDPKHVHARNNCAAIYLQQRRFKEAIWEYTLYLRMVPSDSEGHYNLGVAFMLSGRLKEAVDAFKTAIQHRPQHLDAWCNLGAIYIQQTQLPLAYQAYQRVLSIDATHATAQFMACALVEFSDSQDRLELATIVVPRAAPLEYVKTLFNNYADHFDQHLVSTLHYRVPRQLYHFMQPYIKDQRFHLLDLGCGTGLVGELYQSVSHTLTGVDLSSEMLREAGKKSVYHELIEQDILSFLSQARQCYTLILCVDTLVYFGELRDVFEKVFTVADKETYFGFSIEWYNARRQPTVNTLYYHLKPTGRYQHEVDNVRTIATESGWEWVAFQQVEGRLHQSKPVSIGLCLMKKR